MISIKQDQGFNLVGSSLSEERDRFYYDYVAAELSGVINRQETISDGVFNVYTGATYWKKGKFISDLTSGSKITAITPSIATVDNFGSVSRVSDGVASFHAELTNLSQFLSIDVREKSDIPEVRLFVSSAPGSLIEHIEQQVDLRIAGLNKSENGNVFNSQNHTDGIFVRNETVWCAGVDLTSISPSNSRYGANRAGVLVTPRHYICAEHSDYNLQVGDRIRFVTQDGSNATIERTVVTEVDHPGEGYFPDFNVGVLDSDVSGGISPCSVLPENWNDYLVNIRYALPPIFLLDQEEKALTSDWYWKGSFSKPTDANRLEFFEDIISGDSGNPCFVLINGKLVLLSVLTYGAAGAGSFIPEYIPSINQMIAAADAAAGISTGYTLTEADLSAFPTYN